MHVTNLCQLVCLLVALTLREIGVEIISYQQSWTGTWLVDHLPDLVALLRQIGV